MGLLISLLTIEPLLCTCIFRTDEPSIKEMIARADLIIYAKTVPDRDAKIYMDSTVFVEQINFEIKSVFKGEAADNIRLKNSTKGCGAHFRKGENYIIFAFKNSQSGEFETGGCQSISEWTKNDLENPKNALSAERRFFSFLKDLITKEVKR